MYFYIFLYGSLLCTALIIGVLGVIADARNRDAWREIARECGVQHG